MTGPPVVIYVNGAAWPKDSPAGTEMSSGLSSGRSPPASGGAVSARRGRAYDPYAVARDFPRRWQAYIRANYRSIAHVTQVFEVSERTARKWWAGENGANGGHVAIAVNEHPEEAPLMLFAAE